jgi:uncharacterized membrane protein
METTTNQVIDNGKTAAIVSYLTIIGWLIAYFAMYKDNKTPLAAYHLRQSLLLMLCALVFQFIRIALLFVSYTVSMLLSIVAIGFLILWIMGFIAAINGEEKPMPLIGEKAQDLFKGI